MASVAEPEVQFAQKLASNEKPVRRKALKRLRGYISARSRTHTGFSEEELLKLWKGLFYCLWMQDKPLLQVCLTYRRYELCGSWGVYYPTKSTQNLKSCHLLFFRTFLTTVKREWTGIDRLRMDKYYQVYTILLMKTYLNIICNVFLSSCIAQFLELLSSELLQAGAPPVGLQMHVLDLYLRELAVVGAREVRMNTSLLLPHPDYAFSYCCSRTLFRAICSSIFSTIIDQAPFAIQELLEELEQDSDSGQASEDQEEPEEELKTRAEQVVDEDVGPILQFEYGAVADRLLEVSSRGNTPSRNRQRLYKIVRVLRDLSQGNFPQDEYPDEVSTDEDDDDFGSRKRMKRKHTEEEEEEPKKKAKGGGGCLPLCQQQVFYLQLLSDVGSK
uniref:Ribosomal RNA processing 1 n=1 Tax=Periophthalmus magnuspinnatus TaxID=409849 RepID=A0A3B3ZXR8_9GOBI